MEKRTWPNKEILQEAFKFLQLVIKQSDDLKWAIIDNDLSDLEDLARSTYENSMEACVLVDTVIDRMKSRNASHTAN